jgi:CubicO group peptidase (beta-lactamase class C family)
MEERIAAAPVGRHFGKSAYHALTYGWLLSGLARGVTGKGMRELMRTEVAEPLNTDGIHLGRPPAGAPTQAARFVGSQINIPNPVFNALAPAVAGLELSAAFGAMYVPGVKKLVQRDVPLLDTELPSANGVVTARALAKMYGALANGGMIDGRRYFSAERVTMLTGRRNLRPDRNLIVPLAFHLGYHGLPIPGVLPGFGHVGLAGSFGWAIPEEGLAFSLVHNRLLTPLVMTDQTGFVGTAALVRRGAALARKRGFTPVVESGSTYDSTLLGAVAG